MPPSIDPEVHAVVGRVAVRSCSITPATREELLTFPGSKSQEDFCRNAHKHVQKRRIVEKEEAEAGTAKHYTKAAEKAAAAAQLAATAATVVAAKTVKAAAVPKKVTAKELTRTKMTCGQASGIKKLDKQAKRTRVKALKAACLQFAEVKESGELTSQQVCGWVSYQVCLSPSSAPKPKRVRVQVAAGLAGDSTGKRGRMSKTGAKLLDPGPYI